MLFHKITGEAYLKASQRKYTGKLEFGEKPHSFLVPSETLTDTCYEVTLNYAGGSLFGHCNCPAKILCKHLAKAVDLDALKLRLIDSHNLARAQRLREMAARANDNDFARRMDSRIAELSLRIEAHAKLQTEINGLGLIVPPKIRQAANAPALRRHLMTVA